MVAAVVTLPSQVLVGMEALGGVPAPEGMVALEPVHVVVAAAAAPPPEGGGGRSVTPTPSPSRLLRNRPAASRFPHRVVACCRDSGQAPT